MTGFQEVSAEKELIKWIVEKFYNDPVGYCKAVLKIKPRPWQEKYLRSFVDNQRTACRSGHGVGKTLINAAVVHWFMSTRHNPKVIVTANTEKQLQSQTWAELYNLNSNAINGHWFEWTATRFYNKLMPASWWAWAFSWSADNPESFQGQHRENFLALFDEASSIPPIIFEIIEGSILLPTHKFGATGNPTRSTGDFHDIFYKDRANWNTMKVSCLDVPEVGDVYAKRMAEKYGVKSNVYKVRVEGEFPDQSDNSLISLSDVEAAQSRQVDLKNLTGQLKIGIDVARFGDDSTCFCARRNNAALLLEEYRQLDTMQSVGHAINFIKRAEEYFMTKADAICVDTIGVGAGVADRLSELGYPVADVNVAEKAQEEYLDAGFPAPDKLRDELWWKCREWLKLADSCLIDDEGIIAELTTPTYKMTSQGKLKVESKDDLKKRGVMSPNKADALNLTFYDRRMPGWGMMDFYKAQATKEQEEQARIKTKLGLVVA
jgi:phage terminase large subunit